MGFAQGDVGATGTRIQLSVLRVRLANHCTIAPTNVQLLLQLYYHYTFPRCELHIYATILGDLSRNHIWVIFNVKTCIHLESRWAHHMTYNTCLPYECHIAYVPTLHMSPKWTPYDDATCSPSGNHIEDQNHIESIWIPRGHTHVFHMLIIMNGIIAYLPILEHLSADQGYDALFFLFPKYRCIAPILAAPDSQLS